MPEAVIEVYRSDNETVQNRSGRSKRFFPKVMFLSAAARPQFYEIDDCVFDGKLGIWAFSELKWVERSSKKFRKGH